MDIPTQVTVAAIVKTKAEAPDGFTIELDIATFKSQYPTKVTRVSKELAGQLAAGAAVNVNLVRQALKKRQDGTTKPGDYYSDYYWGLESIAAHDAAIHKPEPDNGATRDSKDESIKESVAIKEIGACLCAKIDVPAPLVKRYWQTIADWLPNPTSQGNQGPQQAPPTEADKEFEALGWPHFETMGAMMTFASKNGVLLQEMASFLRVPRVAEYTGTPDEAWKVIADKKGLKAS